MTTRDRALRALGRVVDDIAREAEKSADPEAALELLELLSDICSRRTEGPWWDVYVVSVIGCGKRPGCLATDDEIARAAALSERCGGWWGPDGVDEDSWRLAFVTRGSR